MKKTSPLIFVILCLSVASLGNVLAWEKEEHRVVADKALAALLAEWNLVSLKTKLTQEIKFGESCAQHAGPDSSAARHQRRGKTILEQLRPLSASLLEKVWDEHRQTISSAAHKTTDVLSPAFSAEQPDQNVIVNYLLHHMIALRFAKISGEKKDRKDEVLYRALLYEARALSYLMDSFAAGHLLVTAGDSLFGLHPINNKTAYSFYRNEGVYVINSEGDVWQTFGNKILQWHAPTYRKVMDACMMSLRELFLVYYVSDDEAEIPEQLERWGQSVASGLSLEELVSQWTSTREGVEYYSVLKMPTLLLLPMPVSATWSVRTDERDEHDIFRRHNYPQLRDLGFHDPDLHGLDQEFLYPRSAIPDWMVPELLDRQNPARLIQSHPDLASVRFYQTRNFPPSYKGLLFHLGGGPAFKKRGSGFGSHIGLGYGLIDNLLVVHKSSIDLELMPSFDEGRRSLLVPSLGFGLKLPSPSHLWDAYRFEIGYAIGLRSPYKKDGLKFAFGIEFPTITLGFTYAGLTIRLMYRRFSLERTLHGIFLDFVLH
jgi:hypothetical protein